MYDLNLQPFVADLNQPVPGLRPGPWALAWQAAGMPDRPTTTVLQYTVDGDWPANTATSTGIDLGTGQFLLAPRAGTVRGLGICRTDPVAVDVFRARLSN